MMGPYEVAKRKFGRAREHAEAKPCLRRQLRGVEALECGMIGLTQPIILKLARLADIVPFILVAADAERRLARRAAIERPLEDRPDKGVEPRVLVGLDCKDRRRGERPARERRRSDKMASVGHAAPPPGVQESIWA